MSRMYRLYCRIYQNIFRLASYVLPFHEPRILEGVHSLLRLPQVIRDHKISRLLLVTDPGLVKIGLIAPIQKTLKDAEIQVVLYDKTVANPTIDNIEEAASLYRENRCQALLAIGGGSPMDLAKGAGARIGNPRKTIPQMRGVLKVPRKIPPLFVVPTTAGTGSETTLAAVITDSRTHEKYALNDPKLIPYYGVLDPTLTVRLPKHITSTTGMDALTHAVEAFIGRSNTRYTEKMALESVRLIYGNLKKAYDDGNDLQARANMQKAAFKAGVAFTRAYVGYVHALAHTLGGFYQVPHGLANAVILPYVLDYFGQKAFRRLAILADAAGIAEPQDSAKTKAQKFIASIRTLNASMNIPEKLPGIIREEDLPQMAQRAFHEGNPLYPVPKFMGISELLSIYRCIM